MNHDGVKQVPWTLEQTPMPASGSDAGVTGTPEGQPVTLDAIVALARTLGFDQRFQLAFPGDETAVWTISRDTMSNDSANPLLDRTVHVDQYTGRILADVSFGDYGAAGKAMAAGIAFHEGDMGLWNLVLVTVFCLSIIFLSVSGFVMWWKRRPKVPPDSWPDGRRTRTALEDRSTGHAGNRSALPAVRRSPARASPPRPPRLPPHQAAEEGSELIGRTP